MNVFLNGINIFRFFFCGIGIVKPQVGFAPESLRQAKVQTYAFGMSYVQITVRFGREPGNYGVVFALRKIIPNDLFQKIQRTFRCRFGRFFVHMSEKFTHKSNHINVYLLKI